MASRKKYLDKKIEETTNLILHTMQAMQLLEKAQTGRDVREAIDFLPDKIVDKIVCDWAKFLRYDMTRDEFSEVLERQIKLRKRSLRRYVKIYREEFGDET